MYTIFGGLPLEDEALLDAVARAGFDDLAGAFLGIVVSWWFER
jgi:hypothetical protein